MERYDVLPVSSIEIPELVVGQSRTRCHAHARMSSRTVQAPVGGAYPAPVALVAVPAVSIAFHG